VLRGVDAAQAAAARGLALFELPPGGRRPGPGWHHQVSTDPDWIRTVLAAGGNLGVGCRASNVIGLDLDRHRSPDATEEADGAAVFAAACTAHAQAWPHTFTVATPHGGLHLYFRAGGRPIASTSGGRSGLGPGIDTRGPGRRLGGYLMAPGSLVAAGAYTVELDAPVMDLPPWLAAVLERSAARAGRDCDPRSRASISTS